MKTIIFILFLFPFMLNAQCDTLVSTIKASSGRTYQCIKEKIHVKGDSKSIKINIIKNKKVISLRFQVIGASKCIRKDDMIFISFVNGGGLELQNNTQLNCRGEFVLYFGGVFKKEYELKKLALNKIESIVIFTLDGVVYLHLTQDQSNRLMNVIKCLKDG